MMMQSCKDVINWTDFGRSVTEKYLVLDNGSICTPESLMALIQGAIFYHGISPNLPNIGGHSFEDVMVRLGYDPSLILATAFCSALSPYGLYGFVYNFPDHDSMIFGLSLPFEGDSAFAGLCSIVLPQGNQFSFWR